jgi:hypothetical protein
MHAREPTTNHANHTRNTPLGGELPSEEVDVDVAAAETKVAAAPTAEEDVDEDGPNQVPRL